MLLLLTACAYEADSAPPMDTSATARTAFDIYEYGYVIACAVDGVDGPKDAADRFNDYGCFSGKDGGGTPVDETDACAEEHDSCYAEAAVANPGCQCNNLFDVRQGETGTSYKWDCEDGTVVCSDANDACAAACCGCDKDSAECFDDAQDTYKEEYKDWADQDDDPQDPGEDCSEDYGKEFECGSSIGMKMCRTPQGCVEKRVRGFLLHYYYEGTCTGAAPTPPDN